MDIDRLQERLEGIIRRIGGKHAEDLIEAIDRLADEGATFDLAFLDPPYREGLSADAVGRLFEKRLIKPGGIVVLEHAAELAPKDAPGIFRVARTKRFGKCGYSFIEEDGE